MTDTLAAAETVPARISHNADGSWQIAVAGQDLTNEVAAVDFHAEGGYASVPDVVLHLKKGRHVVDLDLPEAVVTVVEKVDADVLDEGVAIGRFLTAIDPQLLEEAALNSPDLQPGPHALTAVMLQTLTRWADGRRS